MPDVEREMKRQQPFTHYHKSVCPPHRYVLPSSNVQQLWAGQSGTAQSECVKAGRGVSMKTTAGINCSYRAPHILYANRCYISLWIFLYICPTSKMFRRVCFKNLLRFFPLHCGSSTHYFIIWLVLKECDWLEIVQSLARYAFERFCPNSFYGLFPDGRVKYIVESICVSSWCLLRPFKHAYWGKKCLDIVFVSCGFIVSFLTQYLNQKSNFQHCNDNWTGPTTIQGW